MLSKERVEAFLDSGFAGVFVVALRIVLVLMNAVNFGQDRP